MILPGMTFQREVYLYIKQYFIDNNCEKTSNYDKIAQDKICRSNKKYVTGMPDIELHIDDSKYEGNQRMFEFTSSDYFIFPTHNNYTVQSKGLLGLEEFAIVGDQNK